MLHAFFEHSYTFVINQPFQLEIDFIEKFHANWILNLRLLAKQLSPLTSAFGKRCKKGEAQPERVQRKC